LYERADESVKPHVWRHATWKTAREAVGDFAGGALSVQREFHLIE